MKTIIAGGRDITDYSLVLIAVKRANFDITEVVSGGATGVDTLALKFAVDAELPNKVFKADWGKYQHAAGPIRNRQMAEYADALIVIWDGRSKGTENMIYEAKRRGLKVYIQLT